LTTSPAVNQFDAENRLLESNDTVYTYDLNGNRVSETTDGKTITYTWDSRNRLKSVQTPEGQETVFTYDFENNLIRWNRAEPNGNPTETYVLDDLTNVVSLTDPAGAKVEVLTGVNIDEHLALIKPAGKLEFGLTDALNSTVMVTDENGEPGVRFMYEPFGETAAISGSYPFQFTGRSQTQINLYYYRSRFYDPKAGRFISEDRIGLNGEDANLYRYVANDPISLVDPTGHIIDTVADVGFILYDLYRLIRDNVIYDCDNLGENLVALGADAGGAFIPGATGLGLGTRATKVGGKITGYTRHGINQAISREGVGVSTRAILDAVRNPTKIIQKPGGITEYVGDAARVLLNEAGKVVTVIPRSSKGFRVRK
jgi:RHS repeat-associated protein